MYDPSTVAHDIRLPWPGRKYGIPLLTIWHVDPEKPGTGNRTDDSCGWFDRTPGEYADAVAYIANDQTFMHDVGLVLQRRRETPAPFYEGISERQLSYPRLPASDALAVVLMIAHELELRRWWNGQSGKPGVCHSKVRKLFIRKRRVTDEAIGLALHPLDNLSSIESAESMVRLVAAALNRRFRPWWRHPRWHVHHWRLQVHALQRLNRWLFVRCSECGQRFGWNESPHGSWGGERLWHGHCDTSMVRRPAAAAPTARTETGADLSPGSTNHD